MVASATLMFDQRRLPAWETILRLALALAVIYINPLVHWPAFFIALTFLGWHYMQFRPKKAVAQPQAVGADTPGE